VVNPAPSPATVGIEPVRLNISQLVNFLGMSRAQIYRRFQTGELSAQKDGASIFVLTSEARRYAESRTGEYQPDPVRQEMARRTAPQRMVTRAQRAREKAEREAAAGSRGRSGKPARRGERVQP
jgi:hypothetical protein